MHYNDAPENPLQPQVLALLTLEGFRIQDGPKMHLESTTGMVHRLHQRSGLLAPLQDVAFESTTQMGPRTLFSNRSLNSY